MEEEKEEMCDGDEQNVGSVLRFGVRKQVQMMMKFQFLKSMKMMMKQIQKELVILQILLMLGNCVSSGKSTQLAINWKGNYTFHVVNLQ